MVCVPVVAVLVVMKGQELGHGEDGVAGLGMEHRSCPVQGYCQIMQLRR